MPIQNYREGCKETVPEEREGRCARMWEGRCRNTYGRDHSSVPNYLSMQFKNQGTLSWSSSKRKTDSHAWFLLGRPCTEVCYALVDSSLPELLLLGLSWVSAATASSLQERPPHTPAPLEGGAAAIHCWIWINKKASLFIVIQQLWDCQE